MKSQTEVSEMAGEEGSKVMVAIDESECSHYALEWVLQNLHTSISSPLFIFTSQPLVNFSYIYAASFGAAPPELIQNVREQQKKLSSAIMERAKEICAQKGVSVETIIEEGDPKEAICEAVEKFKIGLLILGNHGRGAIQRAFLGSVSNYCVQNAKCPVLVVKKPA